MKKLIAVASAVLITLLVMGATTRAQAPAAVSVPFTYGAGDGNGAGCTNLLTVNDTTYPQDEGSICFNKPDLYAAGVGFFLSLPWETGTANNGYLDGCNPLTYSAKVWQQRSDGTMGDGTKDGDQFVWPATTFCPYQSGALYGPNFPSFNINVSLAENWVVKLTPQPQRCGSGKWWHRCYQPPKLIPAFLGGSGVMDQTLQ